MSHFNKNDDFDDTDSIGSTLVEKVRWSVRQRLDKQARQLCDDFFDQADDYLFASNQQSQTNASQSFLNSMRELRTKQSLFEESLIGDMISCIASSQSKGCPNKSVASTVKTVAAADFERVEIDLAIRRMRRKAEKYYSAVITEIDAINLRFDEEKKPKIISSAVLLEAVIQSFATAQSLLQLPPDTRLVFLKLFEKHFLLKLSQIFLDFKSILSNYENPDFTEKLVSSSYSFYKKANATTFTDKLNNHRSLISDNSKAYSAEIQSSVDEFISELCDSHRMPLFIEKMIRNEWRAVMFVVGLNSGCDSPVWNESKYTVLMLASAAAVNSQISAKEKQLVTKQLESGFRLVQIASAVKEEFFTELAALFGRSNKTEVMQEKSMLNSVSVTAAASASSKELQEASISPAGKKVLDHDDLDELASLLGGGEPADSSKQASSDLEDYLLEIDALISGQHAQYKLAGKLKNCSIIKSASDFFEIQFDDSATIVKRSRLGLALALKEGDLLLTRARITRSISSITILDHKLH